MNDINFRGLPETEASFLFEKREQDRTNANKAFFPSKKKVNSNFFYIFEIRRVKPEQMRKRNGKTRERETEPRYCMSLVENWSQRHGVQVKCRLALINFPEIDSMRCEIL